MSLAFFWSLIAVMGCVTLLSRIAPFLFQNNEIIRKLCGEDSRLSVLGPAMLASIAASTIIPGLMKTVESGRLMDIAAYCLALAAVAAILKISRNSGLAVIGAMIFYAAMRFLIS